MTKEFRPEDVRLVNALIGKTTIEDVIKAIESSSRKELKPLIEVKAKENQVIRKGDQAGTTLQNSAKLVGGND